MLGIIEKLQIKKSRPNKSYGFIAAYDGESYWFSLKGLDGLQEGDEVSFDGGVNEKGYFAKHVKKVG